MPMWLLDTVICVAVGVPSLITVSPRKSQQALTAEASASLLCGGVIGAAPIASVAVEPSHCGAPVVAQPQKSLPCASFSVGSAALRQPPWSLVIDGSLSGSSVSTRLAGGTLPPNDGLPQTSSVSELCTLPLSASPVLKPMSAHGSAGLRDAPNGPVV